MRAWTLLVLAGCAGTARVEEPVYPERYPVSPGELAHLARAGLQDDAVIANIEREGVVGKLSTADAERLESLGVSERVLDAYRRGRVVVPSGPIVPVPRRPLPEYGRLFDPAWYWEEPGNYPAQAN